MTVEWRELPARLSEVMAIVGAGGAVELTDNGQVRARLEPVAAPAPPSPRTPVLGLGMGRGRYYMAPDFNDPLPDEFWFGGQP